MPKQSMGEFMATLRKANGYTQQEVSDKLNVSNRTLSSWETDRTLPDVLMLPAIADLYGVTVDELLRGERTTAKENKSNDISESSLKSVYKNKYGAFISKRALILGIALICAAVFALACALSLWSGAPAWLDWTLLVLGAVGLCACIAVTVYLYSCTKLSVGVVTDEDLTDDKKAFVTAMRHKLESFFTMCALPFALFAAIVLIVFVAVDPQYGQVLGVTFYVRYGYIFVMCLNFALAAALALTYAILKAVTVKSYYSESQKTTAKLNRKLAGKLAIFGSIPVAAAIAFNIVFSAVVLASYRTTLYKCDDFETFRTHIQTLVLENNPDVPDGEYYLAFPDKTPNNYGYKTEFDLGNGFYATGGIDVISTENHGVYLGDYYWYVTYGSTAVTEDGSEYESEDDYVSFGRYYVHITDEDECVTNVRYASYKRVYWYDDYGNKIEQQVNVGCRKGQYYCETHNTVTEISRFFSSILICTLTVVPLATVAACAIAYAIKRKKQKYNF